MTQCFLMITWRSSESTYDALDNLMEERRSLSGRCFYHYMFHWGVERGVDAGAKDFILVNRKYHLLSQAMCHHILWLARNILEKKLWFPGEENDYNIYPGLLWTEKAYNQQPHIDQDEDQMPLSQQALIVHIARQKNWLLLCFQKQTSSCWLLWNERE